MADCAASSAISRVSFSDNALFTSQSMERSQSLSQITGGRVVLSIESPLNRGGVGLVTRSLRLCRSIGSFREKRRIHVWHSKGFSFVCERS
jgi:hypothetical protein